MGQCSSRLSTEEVNISDINIEEVSMRDSGADILTSAKRHDILRNKKLFVLDNSLRESTVGQIRGHTVDDKLRILEAVKKCGFKNYIVAAFSEQPRVEDEFLKQLHVDQHMFAFTDVAELSEGPGTVGQHGELQPIPIGLRKMKEYKIMNPIIEIDVLDWFSNNRMKELKDILKERIEWACENLFESSRIFINLRDFPFIMSKNMDAVFDILTTLGTNEKQIFGIMFEEPTGEVFPDKVGDWTADVRRHMDNVGLKDCQLLAHIHQKWGLADSVQLECLIRGANGIWASVCDEGVVVGHASSSVTIMNLARCKNNYVQTEYQCDELINAAKEVTLATTGAEPNDNHILYGSRALDIVFDFGNIVGAWTPPEGAIDLGNFFGIERPFRVSTLASPRIIKERLIQLFPKEDENHFTDEIVANMHGLIIAELDRNDKEEYMTPAGLGMLFCDAGGSFSDYMTSVVDRTEMSTLVREVSEFWDNTFHSSDASGQQDNVAFDYFYPEFVGIFLHHNSHPHQVKHVVRKAFKHHGICRDGIVRKMDFMVYVYWAVDEYPSLRDTRDVLHAIFTRVIGDGLGPSTASTTNEEKVST